MWRKDTLFRPHPPSALLMTLLFLASSTCFRICCSEETANAIANDKTKGLYNNGTSSTFVRDTALDGEKNGDVSEDDDEGGEEGLSKQGIAVIFVLVFGIVIGLVVNFVNLHTDFQDCHDFYRGYMGRRLLISEGKLTSRAYLEAINTLKDQQKDLECGEGHLVGNGHAVNLCTSLSSIQEERRRQNPYSYANFKAFLSITPFRGVEPVGRPEHLEWLQQHLPLYALMFIEDHDPEWRELDYSVEIGTPPENLCEFIMQYDLRIFKCCVGPRLDQSDLELRRNLLDQFRKWKKRRLPIWQVVVTERAKKEMANDDMGGTKTRRN